MLAAIAETLPAAHLQLLWTSFGFVSKDCPNQFHTAPPRWLPCRDARSDAETRLERAVFTGCGWYASCSSKNPPLSVLRWRTSLLSSRRSRICMIGAFKGKAWENRAAPEAAKIRHMPLAMLLHNRPERPVSSNE